MLETYRVPAAEARHEIDKIKGSRFIATVAPVADEAEAEARLAALRAEFHDARHTCSAWRLDPGGRRWRAQDDGEPSGSAGRPILAQLEGHDLTGVVLAVTRYFGGTKLGVGGLVRAYGAAAAAVLEQVPVRVVRITVAYHVQHPYSCAGAVEAMLAAHGLAPRDAAYGAEVSFVLDLPPARAGSLADELVERTSGLARVVPLTGADGGGRGAR